MNKNIKRLFSLLLLLIVATSLLGGISKQVRAQESWDVNIIRQGLISWYELVGNDQGWIRYDCHPKLHPERGLNTFMFRGKKWAPHCTSSFRQGWNIMEHPQGESEIKEYINYLSRDKLNEEVAYAKYVSKVAPNQDIMEKREELVNAMEAYMDNPTPENAEKVKESSSAYEQVIAPFNEQNQEANGGIFGTAINALTNALIWAIQPSSYGGYTTGNAGVVTIWKIMRNFVNIGLIIAMIVMAIATILGIEKYSWKKVLWKIVVVALLVNFSLVIVGMIVDIFNYFTVYFLNSAKITATNFGGLFTFHGPTLGFWNTIKSLGNLTKWIFNNLIKLFVGIFVIVILLAALLAMIARAVVIMVLAAISPLAFAAWVFPDTEKWWKMWWDNFLKWTSFGLIFAISLYAGMTIMNNVQLQSAANTAFGTELFTTLMAAIFLLVGLIFSMQSGTAASRFAISQAGKISGAVGKWTAQKTREKIIESAAYKNMGQKLTQVPVLNKIGYNMLSQSNRARLTHSIQEYEGKMKGRDKEELLAIANGKAPKRNNKEAYTQYMAARGIALNNGWIKHNDPAFNAIRKDIQSRNPDLNTSAILKAFPQYFKRGANGKIEELDLNSPDYAQQVAKNLKQLSPSDMKHTERIMQSIKQAAQEAGHNVDESLDTFIQEIINMKTNQLRAFFDNMDEEEFRLGTTFGGTKDNPMPWGGVNSHLAIRLKKLEQAAQKEHESAVVTYGKDSPQARDALKKWEKIQLSIDELNRKLRTSKGLQESLDMKKI